MRLSVMQGRLLPPLNGCFQCFPRGRWREEFPLVVAASLDAIEWIYDSMSERSNPICTDSDWGEVRRLCEEHGIAVVSVCADYFMECPLVGTARSESEERIGKLLWLLERCQTCGIGRVVLPFVDNSKIENDADEDEVVQLLSRVLRFTETVGVELHLETSLDPQRFRSLLAKLPHPLLKINYDSGNSASLGFDCHEELAAYGERIGSVHIKDRILGGGTVPIGTGQADIPELLSGLFRIGYEGDFVMQIARAEPGMELAWIQRNRDLVSSQLRAAGFVLGENG